MQVSDQIHVICYHEVIAAHGRIIKSQNTTRSLRTAVDK